LKSFTKCKHVKKLKTTTETEERLNDAGLTIKNAENSDK